MAVEFRARAAMAALMMAASLASGCASGVGANDYTRSQIGGVNRVEEGVIVAAREVRIEGDDTTVGTGAGAVLGGIAGSQAGQGDLASAAGAVAGAVIGGVVGSAAQRGVSTKRGIAYTVRKMDGTLITVTQGADVILAVGQRVFIEYGARARIVPQ